MMITPLNLIVRRVGYKLTRPSYGKRWNCPFSIRASDGALKDQFQLIYTLDKRR